MFSKKLAPTIAERQAGIAKQREALAALLDERGKLQSRVGKAAECRRAVEATVPTDTVGFLMLREDQSRRLQENVAAARTEEGAAVAALAAHERAHGNLVEANEKLRFELELVEQERFQAAHRADAKVFVGLGSELALVQARMLERLREAKQRWPAATEMPDGRVLQKRGGLAEIAFPVGVFDPDEQGPVKRTVWADHILYEIAKSLPDLLPEHAEAVLTRVANDRQHKVRWFARVNWDTFPAAPRS